MYRFIIASLVGLFYCSTIFSVYPPKIDLSSEDKVIAYLLSKKSFLEQATSIDKLEETDTEMRKAFKINNIFKTQYLSAESLLVLSESTIIMFAKKHYAENAAFSCTMKVHLHVLPDALKNYEKKLS